MNTAGSYKPVLYEAMSVASDRWRYYYPDTWQKIQGLYPPIKLQINALNRDIMIYVENQQLGRE